MGSGGHPVYLKLGDCSDIIDGGSKELIMELRYTTFLFWIHLTRTLLHFFFLVCLVMVMAASERADSTSASQDRLWMVLPEPSLAKSCLRRRRWWCWGSLLGFVEWWLGLVMWWLHVPIWFPLQWFEICQNQSDPGFWQWDSRGSNVDKWFHLEQAPPECNVILDNLPSQVRGVVVGHEPGKFCQPLHCIARFVLDLGNGECWRCLCSSYGSWGICSLPRHIEAQEVTVAPVEVRDMTGDPVLEGFDKGRHHLIHAVPQ